MQITESLEHVLREVLIRSGIGGLRSIIHRTHTPAGGEGSVRQLLQALEMNESSTSALRALIANEGHKPAAEILKELQQILSETPAATGVITEETLQNAEALAKRLSVSLSSEDLKALLLKLNIPGRHEIADAGGETLKDLEKALIRLMQQKNSENPRPLKKLVDILRSLPKVSEAVISQGEKLLEVVIRGQVESLKTSGIDPAAMAFPVMTENSVHTLLATLEKAARLIPSPSNDLEKQFVAFAKSLYADLQKMMLQLPESPAEVKSLMEQAVLTIEKDFQTSVLRWTADSGPSLPRKAQVLLKSIEAQPSTLLTMPDAELFELFNPSRNNGRTSEGVRKILPLIENLRMLEEHVKPEEREAFRGRVDAITQKVSHLSDAKLGPEAIRRTLQVILLEIQHEMGLPPASVKPGPMAPVLEQIQRIEKEIRRVLEGFREMAGISEKEKKDSMPALQLSREATAYRDQEILQQMQPVPQHPERLEQRALLMKDPGVLLVLRLLKNSDLSGLIGSGNNVEKQFVDFLKELIQRLPVKEGRTPAESLPRRQLEEGLAKIEQQFRNEQTSLFQDPKISHLRSVMSSVEQILRGHELLERLNPLMNMAGEPAFLLFPTIIHSFASQIELITYPEPPEEEGEESGKGKSKKRKRSWKRFEFDMQFEGMGRIQSRVMFREGEFILDLTSENEAVASFVEERFPKFEALLQQMGYENVELRATAAPFADLKPSWVPAMLGKSLGV